MARDFDRAFLNQLTLVDWKEIIERFQAKVTDSVIEVAVSRFPAVIYDIDGKTITRKLKKRRDLMMREGLKYYHFLSRYVNIVGSNKREYFRISNDPDGRLKVAVYERRNDMDTAYRLYQRTFDHKDTKELRLYGLNGNDLFVADENVRSRIKIRIIGGRGNDTFDIKSNAPTILYDIDTAANHVVNKNHTRVRFSPQPDVNDFDWVENEYTIVRYPRYRIAYKNAGTHAYIAGAAYRRR